MLIAQITDPHIKLPGRLAYRHVDTSAALTACVARLAGLVPRPDLVVLTGDCVDFGQPAEYAHLKSVLAGLSMPLLVIPGNHDNREALRQAFAAGGYLPAEGFLDYVVETYPVRIVGLDSVVAGAPEGDLSPDRLDWLDRTLSARPEAPTLVMLHHPPFISGIGHMDKMALLPAARDGLAAVVVRHPQIQAILCGHLHRLAFTSLAGRPVIVGPGTSHQVEYELNPEAASLFRMEPPGLLLHWWTGEALVSHFLPVGDFDGPYPFFDKEGKLID